MDADWPEIGSKWREMDNRFDRVVEVVGYSGGWTYDRVRIKNVATGRVTLASPERFNGKSGGYKLIEGAPDAR